MKKDVYLLTHFKDKDLTLFRKFVWKTNGRKSKKDDGKIFENAFFQDLTHNQGKLKVTWKRPQKF